MGESCLIVVGEKSGEEHCLSFLPRLIERNPNVKFFGIGGKDMADLGVEVLQDYHGFASIGFGLDVIKKIPYYFKVMDRMCDEVVKRGCKTAILVDYQGFNLKIGEKLKKLGVNVLHYVAPQAWVWKENRVEQIKKNVHTLFTIVPFEKKWFSDRGVKNTIAVRHPLLDHYEKDIIDLPKKEFPKGKKHILLLPGSRNSEVKNLLPKFAQAARLIKKEFDAQVAIVQSTTVDQKFYQMDEDVFDKVYDSKDLKAALKEADLCISSSGTVTLACALFNVPTLVSYYFAPINEFIGRHIIKYTWYLSLANIIHNEMIFPEYVQERIHPVLLSKQASVWFNNEEKYNAVVNRISQTRDMITGDAIDVVEYMSKVINNE